MLTADGIINSLRRVTEQEGTSDIITSGRISGVSVKGDAVGFVLTLKPEEIHHSAALEAACEREIRRDFTAGKISIISTASASPTRAAPARRSEWNMQPLPFVKLIIAVTSGKGGVGKSTTAVNLAHALAAEGKRVGLLDADIYGPSLPRMMGLSGKPESMDNLIVPPEAHAISCLSMGLLVDESSALVWRGPQASKALYQMLRGTRWGTPSSPLDILLIDMPPGTGDIHLSLVQQVPVNGVITVTTPQDVAIADAAKSMNMFRKVYVKLLGVVENMSGFADGTGKVHAIFGEGGGQKLADQFGVPLLGAIPLDIGLRSASDTGQRFHDTNGCFRRIAERLAL